MERLRRTFTSLLGPLSIRRITSNKILREYLFRAEALPIFCLCLGANILIVTTIIHTMKQDNSLALDSRHRHQFTQDGKAGDHGPSFVPGWVMNKYSSWNLFMDKETQIQKEPVFPKIAYLAPREEKTK